VENVSADLTPPGLLIEFQKPTAPSAVGSVDTRHGYNDGFIADALRAPSYDYIVNKFALGGNTWRDFAGNALRIAGRPLVFASDPRADWGVIILGTDDIGENRHPAEVVADV
jgi:hypothetical protein